MPSMGELIFMPFHVTCVCEGAVPRNEAVAIVPRPYDLMNTGVLCDSRSPKLLVTFCRSATESRFIFVTPMSARRRPVTTASFSRIVREERGSDASGDSQTVRRPQGGCRQRQRGRQSGPIQSVHSDRHLKQKAPGMMPT